MKGRLNDKDRGQWIDNDEMLYLWEKSERRGGGSRAEFIKKNREQIDTHINAILNRKPSK